MGRRYSELPNEFFEACYWMQSRGIPMRVSAELAGIPTSTFRRNYPYWEGYIYNSDGRITGERGESDNIRHDENGGGEMSREDFNKRARSEENISKLRELIVHGGDRNE